ncbi:phage tail protein [Solibacillus sp. FSL W8-0372]|uniref:phage tail protein n=1 Tax=Solibacillus sp. FSL W8-0372 TaxID=2921713 RepID=UPI0030D04E4E
MSVKVDIKRAQDIMELFDATPRQAQIVMWRAITRAATAGRTRASMNVRKNYMVSANDVKKTIKISKKSSATLSANFRSVGSVIPLIDFDTTPQEPSPAAVRTRVSKAGGKKNISNAFVARPSSSGKVHVFTRVGTSRYPLKVLYGPSVPQMIGREDIMDDILNRTQTVLNDRLDHELERLLRGQF